MPALAGLVAFDGSPGADHCSSILARLARLGSDGISTRSLGDAHFGCRHWHCLPEDEFDRQPYVGNGEHFLLVADARVDNRSEIESALGLAGGKARTLSDAELLALGWEKWGLALFDRLLGDVALAVWDPQQRSLTFARTPLSTRPLFFAESPKRLAFASTPSALFAVPGVERRSNVDQFALLMAGNPYLPGGTTPFAGIEAVPQGHAMIFRQGSRESRSLWSPGASRSSMSVAEAGEAMRDELDRAVRAQLRRRGGLVACQLSAGRDSSAVAASAALIERDGIVAVTAAPRPGFTYPDPQWLADESEVAADIASRHRIRHLVCRTEPGGLIDLIDRVSAADDHPFVNVANLSWLERSNAAAAGQGASVLLSGAFGNVGLSLGGIGFLSDYRRERGFGEWSRLAGALGRRGAGWRPLLNSSFGSCLPRWAHAVRRVGPEHWALPLLRPPLREQAEHIRRARIHAPPVPSHRVATADMAMRVEAEDRYSMVNAGLDARDPTSDRRLVELCLSLPAECLVGAVEPRPAYAAAFADRLPLDRIGTRRGFQAADWNEAIDPADIRRAFQNYSLHPLVAEVFDMRAIGRAIERWPSGTGYSEATYELCCNQLLGALSLAGFINVQFPS